MAALLVLLGACATNTGVWTKSGVETAARDADLLACQAETNRETLEAALHPTFYRTARYTYREPHYGLFGPSAVDDDSNVIRQIEGEIAAVKRMRWRAQFGACLEARGYRYVKQRRRLNNEKVGATDNAAALHDAQYLFGLGQGFNRFFMLPSFVIRLTLLA